MRWMLTLALTLIVLTLTKAHSKDLCDDSTQRKVSGRQWDEPAHDSKILNELHDSVSKTNGSNGKISSHNIKKSDDNSNNVAALRRELGDKVAMHQQALWLPHTPKPTPTPLPLFLTDTCAGVVAVD